VLGGDLRTLHDRRVYGEWKAGGGDLHTGVAWEVRERAHHDGVVPGQWRVTVFVPNTPEAHWAAQGEPILWCGVLCESHSTHADGDLFGHFFTGTLEAAVVFARDWAERSARK
jgi:hypothetical protein